MLRTTHSKHVASLTPWAPELCRGAVGDDALRTGRGLQGTAQESDLSDRKEPAAGLAN